MKNKQYFQGIFFNKKYVDEYKGNYYRFFKDKDNLKVYICDNKKENV